MKLTIKLVMMTCFIAPFLHGNEPKTIESIFTEIFHEKTWITNVKDKPSISGEGSNLVQTAIIRQELPTVFHELGITSMLDAPCGDFFWMRKVDLGSINYCGADIVRPIIEKNSKEFTDSTHKFVLKDIIHDNLPQTDLILCRDCLVHFSFENIIKTLINFQKSGARYLLTTTFINQSRKNIDIKTGAWRPLNLEKPPFNFPKPLRIILEQCTEKAHYADKSLGLWAINDIFKNIDPKILMSSTIPYDPTRD